MTEQISGDFDAISKTSTRSSRASRPVASESAPLTMLARVVAFVDDPTQTPMETVGATTEGANEVVAGGGARTPYSTSGSDGDGS